VAEVKFLPELRDFLREHSVIYTVRGYDMRRAGVVVEGVGPCRRIPMGRVVVRDSLRLYVGLSGFSSLEDWCDKINEFVVSDQSRWLYKVEVIERYPSTVLIVEGTQQSPTTLGSVRRAFDGWERDRE